MIKAAAASSCRSSTRSSRASPGITIGQLSGPPHDPANACGTSSRSRPATSTGNAVDLDRRIDRSPCGTGTCAKMAVLHAKGRLALGDDFRHEGILGTVFTGRLVEETRIGRPRARSCRRSPGRPGSPASRSYVVDPTDPFPEGFTVGDIW